MQNLDVHWFQDFLIQEMGSIFYCHRIDYYLYTFSNTFKTHSEPTMKKSNFHLSQIFLYRLAHRTHLPCFFSSFPLFSVLCTLSDPHHLHSSRSLLPLHTLFLYCTFLFLLFSNIYNHHCQINSSWKTFKSDTPELSLNSHFLPLVLCLRAKGFVETHPACLLPQVWSCGIFQAQVYWAQTLSEQRLGSAAKGGQGSAPDKTWRSKHTLHPEKPFAWSFQESQSKQEDKSSDSPAAATSVQPGSRENSLQVWRPGLIYKRHP